MTDHSPDLPPRPVKRLMGNEPFHRSGSPAADNVLGFWRWSASDLLGNTARGVVAEYIVALDLGLADGVRYGWDAFDLKTDDGIAIEVKSGAYIQSWNQMSFSKIIFGIGPSRSWDPKLNRYSDDSRRWADVYVFCVLANKDPETIDPLDLDQWDFYVLPTAVLNEKVSNQKTIGLGSLSNLGAQRTHSGEIGTTIREVLL